MSNVNISGKAGDDESDYDSAEDADFRESDDALSNSSSEGEEEAKVVKRRKDKDIDSGDEATIAKQAKKKRKEVGTEDLILTRAQKRTKAEEPKPSSSKPLQEAKPEELDAMWKQLNSNPNQETVATTAATEPRKDTISIKRTYEFAGQLITEEKEVSKDSAEAKAYLASLHNPTSGNVKTEILKPVARRPVKRKSNLEEMAKGGKPAKLNVLEKSRLDWAGFVDREGINDDLKRFNKDGYVERQEFLKRTR